MTQADTAKIRNPDAARTVVDCDIHVSPPSMQSLLPYLDDHWRDAAEQRGLPGFETIAYPGNGPLTVRKEWRAPEQPYGAVPLDQLRRQALEGFGASYAICNAMYGVQIIHSEDMAAAFTRALNDWVAAEWLSGEPRLRASIVVPMQNPEMAVDEIERLASDRRFVQVMVLVMGAVPLGKRHYWPIYEAAQRHDLPVCVHAGSMYRQPSTGVGWPTYHIQDYFSNAAAFQTQLASLICEGVFTKYPDLKVVMSESGFTWLPPFLWRLDKYWNGLRMEVPWLDRSPTEIVRSNVRFTLQPVDAPSDAAIVEKLFNHLASDELILFSSDYPHWQFDEDPLPQGLAASLIEKITTDNPLATYSRLEGAAQ